MASPKRSGPPPRQRHPGAEADGAGVVADVAMAKAMSHPLRLRILDALGEDVASPSELATQLGEPLNAVSYHVRRLVECQLLELAQTSTSRGAVEHHYRRRSELLVAGGAWGQLPSALKRAATRSLLSVIAREVSDGAAASGFDDPSDQLIRRVLTVDAIGRTELADAVRRLQAAAKRAERQSMARLAEGKPGGHTAELVVMLFRPAEGHDISSA